jgi:peptidoglycan DL-endopeptidase CwlO
MAVLVVGVCAVLAAGLASATVASAAGSPSVSQVQAKVNQLTSQYDQADQQYDQVETQLTAAKQRLTQLDKQVKSDEKLFEQAHTAVAQIASEAYEDGSSDSLAQLLTSNNPSQVLAEAAMIEEIAGQRNEETLAYLDAAEALTNVQQEQQHTEQGIQTLADQKDSTKNHIGTLLNQEKATLDSLTEQEQSEISTVGDGGTTTGTYTGPTTTVMEKAVAYVFDQLGCPYVYGSTGPCADGFDCSGLMYAAYQSAGLTLPRDTYEEWAELPHISESDIVPGDLLIYNDIGHVAMYVGNGMIIDAPHTGADVEEIPMDETWYAENFDGALEP